MNKIYKVVWSKVKHCYVVTSELAKRQTKGCGARSLRMATVSLGVAASLLCSGAVLPVFGESLAEAAVTVTDASNPVNNVTPAGGVKNYPLAGAALGFKVYAIDVSKTTDKALVISGSSNNTESAKNGFGGIFRMEDDVTGGGVSLQNGVTVGALIGGGTYSGSNVTNNTVKVTGGTVDIGVYGGFAYSGKATGNSIEISGDSTVINSNPVGSNYDYSKVAGGGGKAGASKNTVTIKGGTINSTVYGGYSEDGVAGGSTAAEGNKVNITGGKINFLVYGGFSNNSNANFNAVTVSGGEFSTVFSSVYGGKSSQGNATNNSVSVSGGSLNDVCGGSGNGNADNNTVTVTGGTMMSVNGGRSVNGTANNNTIDISGGTIGSSDEGGSVVGAYHAGGGAATANNNKINIYKNANIIGNVAGAKDNYGYALASGNTITIDGSAVVTGNVAGVSGWGADKKENKVFIKNGSVTGDVYGGLLDYNAEYKGNLIKNEVNISGGKVTGNVYGGAIKGKVTGDIKGNKVEITGGTVNEDKFVYGGYGISNSVGGSEDGDGNKVIVSGGEVKSTVLGGFSSTASVKGNNVEIAGEGKVSASIYGGYSSSGTAGGDGTNDGNKVIVSGGEVQGAVTGGYSNTAAAKGNSVEITGGKVGLNADAVSYIYGGFSKQAAATGNKVSISNGTAGEKRAVNIFGGYSDSGAADSNEVNLNGGKIGKFSYVSYIYGGMGKTSASGNTVNITGGAFENGSLYGGYSSTGTADTNIISMTGGTLSNTSIHGGRSGASASGNEVTVSGGLAGYVYGGAATYNTGKMNQNKVTVTGEETVVSGVIGGQDGVENNDNTVLIEDGSTVKVDVYGGYSTGAGSAINNKVTVTDSTVNGNVFGGVSFRGAEAVTKNAVTINNSTIGKNVYGGRQYDKESGTAFSVTGNIVTINGGTFAADKQMYGGFTYSGTTTDNIINLTGTTTGLEGVEIYGGSQSANTGNELHVGGTRLYDTSGNYVISNGDVWKGSSNNTIKTVANFETIALHSVAWNKDVAALEATTVTGVNTLNIKEMKFDKNPSSGESMALLKSGSDVSAITLTYDGGTTLIPAEGVIIKSGSGEQTEETGVNGVKLTTKGGSEKVLLPDKNTITYSFEPGNVKGITFGTFDINKDARDLSGSKFEENNTVDAKDLKFADTAKLLTVNDSVTLVSNASGMATAVANNTGKTVAIKDYEDTQKIKYTAKATGDVTSDGSAVKYTVSSVEVSKVDLAGWSGTTSSVPKDWEGTGVEVLTTGMTVPTTGNTDILTATAGFFDDKNISGDNKYGKGDAFDEDTNGVTLKGYKVGGVKAEDGGAKITYYAMNKTADSMTLGTVEFANKGTTGKFDSAYDVTVASINADGLKFSNKDAMEAGNTMTIVDASGAKKDAENHALQKFADRSFEVEFEDKDTDKSITFTGKHKDTLSQDAAQTTLTYSVGTKNVDKATVSGNIPWDESEPYYKNTKYTFTDSSVINVKDVTFTADSDPMAGSKAMTMITNANGKVEGSPKFEVKLANTTLEATAEGDAAVSGGNLNFTVTGVTLNSVTVNGVGSDAVPESWTAAKDVTIDTDKMADPTGVDAGIAKSVLKATGSLDNSNIKIEGKHQFKAEDFTKSSGDPQDLSKGVTISGTQSKGVLTAEDATSKGIKTTETGKSLVYAVGLKDVDQINLGAVTWQKDEPLDASGAEYNYAKAAYNTNNFGVTYANPEDVAANQSMTLLKANDTLKAMAKEETNTWNYPDGYEPVAGVTMKGEITGKLSKSGNNVVFTATENKATELKFEKVEWTGDTALIDHSKTLTNVSFDGATVDTSAIDFYKEMYIEADQTTTLVDGFDGKPGEIKDGTYLVGTAYEGEGTASVENGKLIYRTTTAAGLSEQTHKTVMAMEAGMALLAGGTEHMGKALESLSDSANQGSDGTSVGVSIGGAGNRYETGSHVNVNSWNAALAIGAKRELKQGSLEYGVFGEYGKGSYKLYNDDGGKGDGDAHYAGGGLMAKWTNSHDVYTEASFRLGRMSDSADNILEGGGNKYGYDVHANYYGAHVGIGKVFKYKGGKSLDVYGKYFYTKRDGVEYDAKQHYNLDAVASSVLRIGARYGSTDKLWNWYGGLAYEYEFDGEAKGTVNGTAIRAASIRGSSVRGELGMKMSATKDNPWQADISIYGYGGKHRGFGGSVNVAYTF